MKTVDLRSDTVTLPTEEMLEAMSGAPLGDDVFGEDPTINELQHIAAKLTGKDAALLVSSGTMGNLVCVLTHCRRGEEVVLGDKSHMFLNECGSMSSVGGVHPHTVFNQPDGTISLGDIEGAIRGVNDHWPRTRLVCLENTHNRCYGAPLTPEYMASVKDLAGQRSLKVHLDGARIFNAVVALDVDMKDLTKHVDSLSFCLSKGLSAPVGSVVCGSHEFIAEARRNRKLLGGGMRQAGIIAAPGIVALGRMVDRIADDHKNARRLAKGIAQIPGLSIDLSTVYTNIVYFDVDIKRITTDALKAMLDRKGIRALPTGPTRFRMVTHYGITEEDIDLTISVLNDVMKGVG
ncbi:MAG: low-specificity L-threonine aldolase [candidate division WOR-3 bacterium]|nr:MAG: low-specificity L-threonine aldolase [candidate division WOR-3 bacterium]